MSKPFHAMPRLLSIITCHSHDFSGRGVAFVQVWTRICIRLSPETGSH